MTPTSMYLDRVHAVARVIQQYARDSHAEIATSLSVGGWRMAFERAGVSYDASMIGDIIIVLRDAGGSRHDGPDSLPSDKLTPSVAVR